jgi:uncharacterized protein YqeY|tara:strand:- start:1351 stop:1794 length:444 start_codon:yes stop_codon:yes gene_type:complete
MSLKDTLKQAMKDAMRAKEKQRLGAIRLIQAEIKRIEVDERIDIEDDRVLVILDKMLKQRRDSISQYQAAERNDLADIEIFEVGVIQEFLPAQLSADEIATLIDQAISTTGASEMKDMGKVMGMIKPKAQGRADMGAIGKLIKDRFK